MAQITYTDKVALNENPEIAAINKVSDDDMNEIKSVVNANYNNTIQITNIEPTDSDNKIWIDTGEIAQQVSEITNSYSTSTGIGYSANYVNTMNTYSSTEVRCGTWYNGKPLYQRTIYISSLPNNTTDYYDIFSSSEIGNIGVCFMDEGNSYMTITSGGHTETDTLNWIYSTTAFIMTCIYDKQIRIITKDNKSAFSAYITVKYTKTTD